MNELVYAICIIAVIVLAIIAINSHLWFIRIIRTTLNLDRDFKKESNQRR